MAGELNPENDHRSFPLVPPWAVTWTGSRATLGALPPSPEAQSAIIHSNEFQWVPRFFLCKHQVQPWADLPLFGPEFMAQIREAA